MLVGVAKDIMNCFQLVCNVSCVYIKCYLNSAIIGEFIGTLCSKPCCGGYMKIAFYH